MSILGRSDISALVLSSSSPSRDSMCMTDSFVLVMSKTESLKIYDNSMGELAWTEHYVP